MGRAERRASERRNRLEDRKGKILISPDEINKMKKDIAYQATGYKTEALMTCFALTMSRMGLDDYKKELEEKTGIIVKCED